MSDNCDGLFEIPTWAVIIICLTVGTVAGCIGGWCFRRDYVNYWSQREAAARAGRIARMSPTANSAPPV